MKYGFRNYLNHRFDMRKPIDMNEYAAYLDELKQIGATEIEHAGRRVKTQEQTRQIKNLVEMIHERDMRAALYTGVFGTEDCSDKRFERYAQRGKDGNILCYGGSEKSAMMCPASTYVKEVVVPEVEGLVEKAGFDSIFIDIPWIMKGGCHCRNCAELRDDGDTNREIVRKGLDTVLTGIKKRYDGKIGINASAPGIYNANWRGADISNLSGFDEYITEWNPYRWNMNADVVGMCIKKAKTKQQGRFYHATTCTDRKGKVMSDGQLTELFLKIILAGATPRLGIGFGKNGLKQVGSAFGTASVLAESL